MSRAKRAPHCDVAKLSVHQSAPPQTPQSCLSIHELAMCFDRLYNHLRNTVPAQCFATLEGLALDPGEGVEDSGE